MMEEITTGKPGKTKSRHDNMIIDYMKQKMTGFCERKTEAIVESSVVLTRFNFYNNNFVSYLLIVFK